MPVFRPDPAGSLKGNVDLDSSFKEAPLTSLFVQVCAEYGTNSNPGSDTIQQGYDCPSLPASDSTQL